ncbi:nectin-4-like isoform X2 [Oncorhynchus nerka]|uniref:nectin-4-like isoform X2 n=1 Tax=Oncorhynchus nerka TaxID=8023 RepID=UPI0031B7EBC0
MSAISAEELLFIKAMRRANMLLKLSCVILLIIQRDTESTRVIGECRTVVLGEDVDLYCRLIETTEDLEQITWQKSTAEETQNHNFMLINPHGVTTFIAPNGLSGRVQFIGNPSENLGSIRITAVRLLDEGTFTCIFSVFPSGAYNTEIRLTVLVPPVVSVTIDVPPVTGKNEVVLATCMAAGAKPQADVKWKSDPPQTVNVTFSEASKATVLRCVADGNPHPNYTWSRVAQPWPGSSVRAEGDILHFLSLSSELNGLYVCEASNPYGRATGSLNVHISSESSAACWVLLVVILCLIVAAAALIYRCKYGQFPWSPIIANQQFQAPPQVEEDDPGTSGF